MKSFTLIEVIIAVILALVISSVAFNISSQSKYFLSLSQKRKVFYYKASVMALNKVGKNAYELLKDFNIKNDKIIYNLKKDKFNKVTITEYSLNDGEKNNIKITLNKIKIFNKNNSLIIYAAGIK